MGMEPMRPMVAKRFSCIPNLYGDWVSVNKTLTMDTVDGAEILQMQEVQVFGSEYCVTMHDFNFLIL